MGCDVSREPSVFVAAAAAADAGAVCGGGGAGVVVRLMDLSCKAPFWTATTASLGVD